MPANTKWPDFQFASKLRYLMGSQPGVPEATTPNTKKKTSSPQLGRPHHRRDARRSETDERIAIMADFERQPVDELEGLESFENEDAAADADADFGDLEMFDSNASQLPFSSQPPQSIKSEEPVFPGQNGSAKRDKKKKSKSDSAAAEPESSSAKRKKSKRKSIQESDITDPQAVNGSLADQDPTPPPAVGPNPESAAADGHDPAAALSTQTKKKRKLSDSAEGKRRKKRKSQDHGLEDVVPGTQEEAQGPFLRDIHATAFLRMDKSAGGDLLDAIEEGDTANANASGQTSPSVARLRRRSDSREARSRENSVPFRAAVAPMGIDGLPRPADDRTLGTETANDNQTNDPSPNDAAEVMEAGPDVESLAREAWREHVTGQTENGGIADAEQPPQTGTSTNDAPGGPSHAGEQPNESPKRRRSARTKKSKPTFFEQPAAIGSPAKKNRRALEEIPSPTAANSPRPKAKAKRPAKKRKEPAPEPQQLSQSMQEDSEEVADEAGYEEAPSRQSQSGGYTQGRFTDDELARITRAVESFRTENDLTVYEVNEMIQAPGGTTAGDMHAQLWIRLVAECPDRKRQKVINVARKKFHNFVARGTWTFDQDTELTALIGVHGTAWSKIAAIINRHPEDVRDRYRNYIVCGTSQRKETWNEEEEARLREYVKEAMETIDELRNADVGNMALMRPYEELIDWQSISEKMDRTRSRLQCITKWKSMQHRGGGKKKLKSRKNESKSDRSEPKPIESDEQMSSQLETARQQLASMREEEQYRLVLAINTALAASDGKIPWSKLLDKKFRSQWSHATRVLLWDRLKQSVPGWESRTEQDLSQSIINEYNRTGGMPEVTGAGYDDDDREMDVLRQARSRGASNGATGSEKQPKSAEFVVDSDADDKEDEENDGGGNHNKGDQVDDVEMNIDPALTQEPLPVPKATPAKKATPKRQYSAKKKSKKATMASQDPIEDGEQVVTLPTLDEGEESNIDEEQFRKKKTPSKFKTLNGKSSESPALPQQEPSSDSVMDDMEDLPARVATQLTTQ